MLDLIPLWDNANQAISATFLEPACGDGNFLAEIITRKLDMILRSRKPNYKKDQPAFEKAMLVAVGSVYGIDIMQDNTKECVARLYKIICEKYEKDFSAILKSLEEFRIKHRLEEFTMDGYESDDIVINIYTE